jgi:biotin carboxyl carrier protein
MAVRRYDVSVAGKSCAVELEELDGEVRVVVDGRERRLAVRAVDGGVTWLDGTRIVSAVVDGAGAKTTVTLRGRAPLPVEVKEARSLAAAALAAERARPAGPVTVRAPIPGRVAKILVQPGEKVAAGRPLAVLEAMKMENEIRAPRDGVVQAVHSAEGAAVEANQELVTLA